MKEAVLELEPSEKLRRGRPALPLGERRVQITTSVPLPLKIAIEQNGWRVNELIADGVEHRSRCAGIYEKIGKLQAILDAHIEADKEAERPIGDDAGRTV